MTLLMGAVAYDPKVVTIWEGFRALASRQRPAVRLRALLQLRAAGRGPGRRAHPRRVELAAGLGARRSASPRPQVAACGRRSCATPTGPHLGGRGPRRLAASRRLADLAGRRSRSARSTRRRPRSSRWRTCALPGCARRGLTVRRFDVGVGLHGDHVGGERDAARALVAGEVDAACMIDAQPPAVHAGRARCRAGRDPHPRPDRAVRPLQHDRGRHRAGEPGGPVRRAAAVDVLRGPRGPAAARPRRADRRGRWAARAATRQLDAAVDESAVLRREGRVTAAEYAP